MLEKRIKLPTVGALMPQGGQLGIAAIGYALQHSQRERPVLLLWAQLCSEIEDMVVGGGVAVTKAECDYLAGGPARAAIVNVNVCSRRCPGDLPQNLRNGSCRRRLQRVEEINSRVIVERTRTPSAHCGPIT